MSTTRSWRQRVLEADPDFLRKSLRPVVYIFSSGRKFTQPADPYQGGFQPAGGILTEDDAVIMTEGGDAITVETP